MKMRFTIVVLVLGMISLCLAANAQTEERELPVFTEISLRIPAKLYIQQGDVQKVTIDANSSTLKEIITEISGRALVIRFPAKNYIRKSNDPGKITIHVTIPEITGLNLSGSGDIYGDGPISSLILDLNVSGSGNIDLEELKADRIKTNISGSGNVLLKGEKPASEFTGLIAGSGNIKAEELEAREVKVTIAGSGNCSITSNGHVNVRIAGSGNLYYAGNPDIDTSIAGSGSVKEIK